MHHFLIAIAKTPTARSGLIRKLEKGVEHLVPYVPGRMHMLALSERTFFVSAENHDFLGLGAHHLKQGRDFVTYDGFCWLQERETQTVSLFLNAFRDRGAFGLNDALDGEYCAAWYHSGCHRLIAVADFTGLRPIYYMDTPEYFAVSNRQMFLNPLLIESERISLDLQEAADLVAKGNKFTDRSILQGVRMLRPGFAIAFTPGASAEIRRSGSPIFTARGLPKESDYVRSVSEIVRNLDALDNMPGLDGLPIPISLTGGEDSRLVLAAALESRIADRVETFTYGFADNPDITAAEMVARKAGVPHNKRIHAPPINASERAVSEIWTDLTRHAYRFEGAPGAWDGGASSATKVGLDVVGYFDAYFKRVRPASAEIDVTSREVARAFMREPQQPFDPLGVLTPQAIQRDTEICNAWLESVLDEGAELNDIPELFYFDFRLPWWGGAIAANVGSLYRMAPLASKFASRTGLKQTVTERRERKFVFEAMKILRPDLLELPYLNKKWPDHFQAASPGVRLPGVELQLPAPRHQSIPWPITLARRGGNFIHEYVNSHEFNGLKDVIDLPKLSGFLADPTRVNNSTIVRSIVNLCEILILAADDQSRHPDKIEKAGLSGPRLVTDIPELIQLASRSARPSGTQIPNPSPVKPSLTQRTYDLSFPDGPLSGVRIDPATRSSELILHSLSLLVRDGSVIPVKLKSLLCNSEITADAQLDGTLKLKAVGTDPHLYIPSALNRDELVGCVLKISASPSSGALELFFDQGQGFTRKDKITIPY